MSNIVDEHVMRTCHDCKKQDWIETFPKQKNRTKAEPRPYKTCRDCKKQELYDTFPKYQQQKGNSVFVDQHRVSGAVGN
jgi:hypothetical protein